MAQYHTQDKKIQSKQLADFRSKKGPYAGNTSSVFYASYVYFEKLRFKDGKAKSKSRLDMEKVHPMGFDTERTHNRVWLHVSETASQDKYGRLTIHRK